MRLLLVTICSVIIQSAFAQLQLVPIPRSHTQVKTSAAGRTKATLSIPFWDDFSDANTTTPSSDLWFAGNSTWINDGLGINPPSLNVASFDGVDSLGKPYSVNDVLAKGYADKLESYPIDLLAVPVGLDRDSVYLSFFYEMKGRGELPDAGDKLVLEFRNSEFKWEQVWAVENDGTHVTDVFTQVVLPVTADKFYHDDFRFRFKNFARLSGPYDTWHVDYIYLNKGRALDDVSYPDRSIVSPMTSIFKVYHAIPKDHFFVVKDSIMATPTMVITNHQEGNTQPLTYNSYAQIEEYDGATPVLQPVTLVDNEGSAGAVLMLEYKTVEVSLEDLSDLFDESADSLHIMVKVGLATADNVPPPQGDYGLEFAPIDFRLNDTTRTEYWLSSYYAYDDGAAEYGAALNQPGAQVAYEYNLVGVDSGFVNFLQLCFPRFGDETSQVIELRIWKDLLEEETSLLHSELVTLQRTDNNNFWLKKLSKSVKVSGRFYIGWRQSSSAVIAVGFDKNTNSKDKIRFNINGTWEDNTLLTGSLMMRPVFGPGPDDPGSGPVGVKESYLDEGSSPFPNPSNGAFIIPGYVNNVNLMDLSGRSVAATIIEGSEETQVTLANPSPGLYVVRYFRDGFPKIAKIMVR